MSKEVITEIVDELSFLVNEEHVSQNVKRNAQLIIETLKNDAEPLSARQSRVNEILERISADPNLDMPARNSMFHVVTLVESLAGQNG